MLFSMYLSCHKLADFPILSSFCSFRLSSLLSKALAQPTEILIDSSAGNLLQLTLVHADNLSGSCCVFR